MAKNVQKTTRARALAYNPELLNMALGGMIETSSARITSTPGDHSLTAELVSIYAAIIKDSAGSC